MTCSARTNRPFDNVLVPSNGGSLWGTFCNTQDNSVLVTVDVNLSEIRSSYCDTETVSNMPRTKNGYKTRSIWGVVYQCGKCNWKWPSPASEGKTSRSVSCSARGRPVMLRHKADCIMLVQPPPEALTDDLSLVTLNRTVVFRVTDMKNVNSHDISSIQRLCMDLWIAWLSFQWREPAFFKHRSIEDTLPFT
jgi:hypothetical protein